MCTFALVLFLFFALLLCSRRFRVALGLIGVVVVLVVLAVISARADTPKVPKELQDIWCASRLRIGGVPEGNCFRFGPKWMTVEGEPVTVVSIKEGPRHTYHVTYQFRSKVLETLVVKHRNYIMARDRDRGHWRKPVRHNRGNPYAEFYQ
jgi:hypothetical protein